jgi:hypothetical protein
MTVYIEPPEGYLAENIDPASITLSIDSNNFVVKEEDPTEVGDYDENGVSDLMVKFDRQALISVFNEGLFDLTLKEDYFDLMISGLVDGYQFEGIATIRVINKGK